MNAAPQPTPRQARLKLNKMEAWFRRNETRYSPEDRVLFRSLFEVVEKPDEADTLAGLLRERLPESNLSD